MTILDTLDVAPFLKTLPGEVSDVQKEVAQFGSRLKDLESQLAKSQTDFKSSLNDIKQEAVNNRV